jgi:mannose-1-phosphate guanylyltransferase
MLDRASHLWAVILAGGEGSAVVAGQPSMVRATIDRIAPLVPAERIVVVVGRPYERAARQEVAEHDQRIAVLVQPRDLDTGPGVLLPLAWIRARDGAARVVVLPADQRVDRPEVLLAAIERAAAASGEGSHAATLLAAEADRPETELGWIVPGRRLPHDGMRMVQRVFEKPGPELAEALLGLGALWNTLIMVGSVEPLWQLGERHMPEHAEWLARCAGPGDLERAYDALPAVNFTRAVLERARDLAMLPLRGAGWSDLGIACQAALDIDASDRFEEDLAGGRLLLPFPGLAARGRATA